VHNPDVFHVHMTYNGTTLTMTITDTANSAAFTTSWPVRHSQYSRGGARRTRVFTAGTGGFVAIQDILDWTFVSNSFWPTAFCDARHRAVERNFHFGADGKHYGWDFLAQRSITRRTAASQRHLPQRTPETFRGEYPRRRSKPSPLRRTFSTQRHGRLRQSPSRAVRPRLILVRALRKRGCSLKRAILRSMELDLQLTDTAATFEAASAYWKTPGECTELHKRFHFPVEHTGERRRYDLHNPSLRSDGDGSGRWGARIRAPALRRGPPGYSQERGGKNLTCTTTRVRAPNSTGMYAKRCVSDGAGDHARWRR